jgi:hypothetical protein
MLLWYALVTLTARKDGDFASLAAALSSRARDEKWDNLGGQLAPVFRIDRVLAAAREGRLPTWREMHGEYSKMAAEYGLDRARHAWAVLAWLEGKSPDAVTETDLAKATDEFTRLSFRIEEEVYRSRKKDHDNRYRRALYRSGAEMEAVIGKPEKNPFVLKTKKEMAALRERAAGFLAGLR